MVKAKILNNSNYLAAKAKEKHDLAAKNESFCRSLSIECQKTGCHDVFLHIFRIATWHVSCNTEITASLGSVDVWFTSRVCADFGLKQGARRVA